MPSTTEGEHGRLTGGTNASALTSRHNEALELPTQVRPLKQWAGPVVLIVAVGALGQAWISYEGRTTGSSSSILFYITLSLIYAPSAVVILSRKVSDGAKVWFTLYMSLALLATRFLQYPSLFAYHDELAHQGVVRSIDRTGHLFQLNSILPEASDYPGMETATNAIQRLTGLSLHSSGMVMLGMAHIISTLALIRLVQQISESATAGCLAALIYICNQEYLLFNSQFSYASLALPLAFFCIYVFVLKSRPKNILGLIPIVAIVTALVATHHLTSLALIMFLGVWYLLTRLTGRTVPQLLVFFTLTMLVVAIWTWHARALILPYIRQALLGNINSVISLIHGGPAHRLFSTTAGYKTPEWEVVISISTILLITITLILATWYVIRRWHLIGASGMVLAFMAIAYPFIPAGHLTVLTAEVTDRSSPFLFSGLSYVIAVWWLRQLRTSRHSHASHFRVFRPTWLLVLGLTVCFVGGGIIGASDWSYVPGKYMVIADNRSIDQFALAAGYWEAENIRPNSRVYTDRDNGLIAQAYGSLHVITVQADGIDEGYVSNLLLSPLSSSAINIACATHVQYLISDDRLASGLPELGFYIDSGEFMYGTRNAPPAVSDLTKFDQVQGAERIYDNGAIRIFGLGGLSCAG